MKKESDISDLIVPASSGTRTPTTDEQYLAELEADKVVRLRIADNVRATIQRRTDNEHSSRQARRLFVGWCLGGLAGLAIALAIVGVVFVTVRNDDAAAERDKQRQAETAQTCIRQGNLWVDGNCLLARQDGPK